MKTWEFSDEETGEDFFVEAPTREEAIKKARVMFNSPECFGEVSEAYAEAVGWDTY